MSDFSLSCADLHADRGNRNAVTLGVSLLALGAWVLWATCARVSLHAISDEARVELDGTTYPIVAPLVGRVNQADLRVGRVVHRGDLLLELDSTAQALELAQVQTQASGLEARLVSIRAQINSEERARTDEESSAALAAREAEDRLHAAQMPAQFAERELARLRRISEPGLVSTHEMEKAETEAGRLHSELAALESAASRVPREQAARDREGDVRIARLRGEIAALEGERDTLHAQVARLQYEIERRRVRAPVDGHIGEALALRDGAVVSEGANLGSLVASGRLRVIALYPAQAAIGRIREGQPATLRLQGFAWAEFGTVVAHVARVAQEVRDGKVRVELALDRNSTFRGTLEHGMPGTLEVEIDRVSPLGLALRSAGQWLTSAP
jgi:multidrug resistance efflux pump